ncbi:hypothetical protein Goari_023681 [Gossypium aridum]|uniref:Uncharacterized protein n=1 Tax=Gossypium aridum TaxID=34290 RepID=A0A7J8X4P0_GOSAI|nr:hypothetical protein [Gossypium aridum]
MLAAYLVWKIITQFASVQNLSYYKPTTVVIPLAPRRIDHVASKPEMWKHLKVRVEAKRLKVEMGKVREDQECLRVEQRNLITSEIVAMEKANAIHRKQMQWSFFEQNFGDF